MWRSQKGGGGLSRDGNSYAGKSAFGKSRGGSGSRRHTLRGFAEPDFKTAVGPKRLKSSKWKGVGWDGWLEAEKAGAKGAGRIESGGMKYRRGGMCGR